MKVYVNRKPIAGPWGGGSKVLAAILNALKLSGHEIFHDLVPGLDVLFCVDPRPGSEQGLYGYQQIHQYSHGPGLERRTKIVQRVGDIGTHGKPELFNMVLGTTLHSDTVIFPSAWARDCVQHTLEINDRRPTKQWHVIPNAPLSVFFKNRNQKENLPKNISFVSHHWSTNAMKGFEFYKELDQSIIAGDKFTYYGRVPEGLKLKTSVNAMNEMQLAEELPKHDVYVTASLKEAGANHVLEAIAAGLPVIYHEDGGSINEYCSQYGVSFDGTMPSFQRAVEHIQAAYPKFKRNIKKYRMTADDIAMKYVGIIEAIV